MLVKIKESTSLDDKQKLFEGNGECYNKDEINKHLLKSFQDKRRCDKALKTLKATADTDTMLKLMEKHADCYNKEAMKTYFDAEQQKRKTCDEMLVKIKELRHAESRDGARATIQGQRRVLQQGGRRKIPTQAATQAVCDRALESAKAVSANKDALAEVLEKHAGCYNIETMKTVSTVQAKKWIFSVIFFFLMHDEHLHGLETPANHAKASRRKPKKSEHVCRIYTEATSPNNHDLQDCHGTPFGLPWKVESRSRVGPAGPCHLRRAVPDHRPDEHARIRKLEQHFNDEEQTTNPEWLAARKHGSPGP